MGEDFLGLTGKKALVIGGGRGIGESTAVLLAKAGCDVTVLDSDSGRAEGVAQMVRSLGRSGYAIAADVTEEAAAIEAVAKAHELLGGLDVMATIVGQAQFSPLIETTAEVWDSEMRRNVRYVFVVAREAAKVMIRQGHGGAIACVASVNGIQSAPHHAAYGAAKAGLMHLVKTMAVEWAQYNIRVNAVSPGVISTPRMAETEESRKMIYDSLVPMRRPGKTDDIGRALLFLLSDMAGYISGQTLGVDGGWMAANLFDPSRVKYKKSALT